MLDISIINNHLLQLIYLYTYKSGYPKGLAAKPCESAKQNVREWKLCHSIFGSYNNSDKLINYLKLVPLKDTYHCCIVCWCLLVCACLSKLKLDSRIVWNNKWFMIGRIIYRTASFTFTFLLLPPQTKLIISSRLFKQ